MSTENLVRRILHVATCPKCGDRVTKESNPPRERYCVPCGVWVPYETVTWTGTDKFTDKDGA